jgi:molecular chaperone DnaK
MHANIEFGIDLGTTNSCVARWEEGGVRVFQNNDQMNVTPSAVYINRSGRKIIGMRAYSALRTDPSNVATEFKRWMGQKDRREFPASKQSLSAEELSAEILKSLRDDVRRHTGSDLTSAVITVPAAFGALQCEATARAATLAGIIEAPLLQEPIAAAIGYGVRTQGADQHWLVFDLGGGTLDIAVVSTREGRLNVLEHMGNNLRGGKDIDRAIVDEVLLPAIKQQFDIRSLSKNQASFLLLEKLRCEAERAKIALSNDTKVPVALFDLGNDDSGKPVELEVELTRPRLESLMQPVLDECMGLAKAALAGARIAAGDLDRILLVGGPTQAPSLRNRLAEELGAAADFSIDPMTVVARGAALYAASVKRTQSAGAAVRGNPVPLQLAYEPVSAALTCVLAGRVGSTAPGWEVKVDADGGFWTSGWLALKDGIFETTLHLKRDDVTAFRVSLRDEQGRLTDTDSPTFHIRHGLVPSEPPLPHSVSVEVLDPDGKAMLDLIFPKGTPLPSEKTIKYRTAHALIPGKTDSDIHIKVWEGELLDCPEANDHIINLELRNDGLPRRVPEGSEIDITIEMSASRLIKVSAYVPLLNWHFSNDVYVPLRGEKALNELAEELPGKIRDYTSELKEIAGTAPADAGFQQLLQEVRSKLIDLEYKFSFVSPNDYANHPDEAKRALKLSGEVKGGILRLRYRRALLLKRNFVDFLSEVRPAIELVERDGDPLDKQALSMLRADLEEACKRREDLVIQHLVKEFGKLRWRVRSRQESFWRKEFELLCEPRCPFIDGAEAKRQITRGRSIPKGGDLLELSEVVRALWKLLPKSEEKTMEEQVTLAGITRYR